jgi:hypothetical protein
MICSKYSNKNRNNEERAKTDEWMKRLAEFLLSQSKSSNIKPPTT